MRILYLLNNIESVGGISTITIKKIEWFIKVKGYSIVVFVKSHHSDYEEKFNGKLKIYNFGSVYDGLSGFKKIWYVLKFKRFVKGLIKKHNIQICVSTLTSLDFFTLVSIYRKVPKVLEIHSTSKIIIQKSYYIKKHFYKLYDKVVLLNNLEKSNYGLKNVTIIPNFIDPGNNYNKKEKKKIIISGGRNDVLKQWNHQIKAWNLIYNKTSDWEYHLYIDANEEDLNFFKSVVEKNCNSIKINQAIPDFRDKIMEASILVLSSKLECFPLNILEAFAEKTAVISYKTYSGPLTLIEHLKTGVLVDQDDVKKLSEAIEFLINNEEMRNEISENAKEFSTNFAPDKIMNNWLSLFESLIHENS
ncbi:glycosyltransferase [Fontibacter flavus]|uniref:Glycosyltransferase n=1 Tax=Fontibacter flavus TaxID=654838 RepID=A0ABV6FUD7_9BACT